MEWFSKFVLGMLPFAARTVLQIQRRYGVTHPTWVGSAAEWILRGDRRGQGGAPADFGPLQTARRMDDDPEAPGGGA